MTLSKPTDERHQTVSMDGFMARNYTWYATGHVIPTQNAYFIPLELTEANAIDYCDLGVHIDMANKSAPLPEKIYLMYNNTLMYEEDRAILRYPI